MRKKFSLLMKGEAMRSLPLLGLVVGLLLVSSQGAGASPAQSGQFTIGSFLEGSTAAACGGPCSYPEGPVSYSWSIGGTLSQTGTGCPSLSSVFVPMFKANCVFLAGLPCEAGCACVGISSSPIEYSCPSIPAGSKTIGSCTISWTSPIDVTVSGSITNGTCQSSAIPSDPTSPASPDSDSSHR